MNVEISKYLINTKPLMKKLLDLLLEDFNYASILGTDSYGKSYSVSNANISIGPASMAERGFVVRVYNGVNYSEYSFNVINEENLLDIVENIKNNLLQIPRSLDEKNAIKEYEAQAEDEFIINKEMDIKIHPKTLGDEKIVSDLKGLMEEGLGYSEKLISFRVNYEYLHISKVFLSPKKDLSQGIMWGNATAVGIASDNGKTKYHYKGVADASGAELLDRLKSEIKEVADLAVALLDSEPIKPGEYECICTPDITGLIAHEAFGHGVEMDMFLKDRAKSKEYFERYVASPLVTMHDGASTILNTGSFIFDDEGNVAQDTVVIKDGVLKSGINDGLTAMALNVKPSGNGRRESFERKAYTRMTNTVFLPGDSKVSEMIESIKDGFMLEGVASGMEDPKNWGIQCMFNLAREIKDGKLTGKIYSPIILTGYVPELLKSITMLSDEAYYDGAGFCGKGYKEWVKVSAGGPYIKVKARLA